MAHALARRRRDTGDVGHDRLGDMRLDVLGRFLFLGAADLTNHDDAFGLRIVLEPGNHIDKAHAMDGVTANAHACGLTQAVVGGLEDRLIGQGPGARHNADLARFVNMAWHDADLAFTRRDHTRAIRPDQYRVGLTEGRLHPNHVQHRNMLGDAYDDLNARVDRLEHGVCRKRCWHVDHAGIRAGFGDCISHRVEHGPIQMGFAAASGRDATH